MRFWNFIIIASLAFLVAGCASPKTNDALYTVYFPDVKLKPEEHIQRVQLDITDGNVVTVNLFLPDWDTAVEWDNPELQYVKLQERHFVSGLDNIHKLDGFITIKKATPDFDINATLTTEGTDSSGNGERNIILHGSKLILKKK
jgi:hypothetical protein